MTQTTTPTPEQVLALPLPDNDSGADTVRGYLVELLRIVWDEKEGFSGKRPFGNSSWQYDLYKPMIDAGWITGAFDQYGYVEHVDSRAADALIDAAIRALATPTA